MPSRFKPGDKVISDRYGLGRVTGLSAARAGVVLVTFADGQHECAYDDYTGNRLPRFGHDTITEVAND